MSFAREHVFLSKEDEDIINHSCSSFLFSGGVPWSKKSSSEDLFDVTMGSYAGAELSECVGLYLLHLIISNGVFSISQVGIYRDDGLAITEGSGPQIKRKQKKLISSYIFLM